LCPHTRQYREYDIEGALNFQAGVDQIDAKTDRPKIPFFDTKFSFEKSGIIPKGVFLAPNLHFKVEM
jgi:hypothetical protein